MRFRGGFQHAVRSPTIAELYSPQVNNFPTFTNQDPCNTTGAIAATYRNGPNGAQVRALCTAQSAVAEVEERFGIPVRSIVALDQLVTWLEGHSGMSQVLADVRAYRERYGTSGEAAGRLPPGD